MANTASIAANAFGTLQELSARSMAPAVLKQDALSLKNNVLTVRNPDLAHLIQSKLSAAAQMSGAAATDADFSVGVKVRF